MASSWPSFVGNVRVISAQWVRFDHEGLHSFWGQGCTATRGVWTDHLKIHSKQGNWQQNIKNIRNLEDINYGNWRFNSDFSPFWPENFWRSELIVIFFQFYNTWTTRLEKFVCLIRKWGCKRVGKIKFECLIWNELRRNVIFRAYSNSHYSKDYIFSPMTCCRPKNVTNSVKPLKLSQRTLLAKYIV